jgi:hypothetical protein
MEYLKSAPDNNKMTPPLSPSGSSVLPQVKSAESNITKKNYYMPDDLNESIIFFIDTESKFREMLKYFEDNKPDVIGMDCEWKPFFDLIEKIIVEEITDQTVVTNDGETQNSKEHSITTTITHEPMTSTAAITTTQTEDEPTATEMSTNIISNSSKKQCAAIFQIAVRSRVFILDTKYLIDNLSDELLEKFGDLILFSESLIKLGKLLIL